MRKLLALVVVVAACLFVPGAASATAPTALTGYCGSITTLSWQGDNGTVKKAHRTGVGGSWSGEVTDSIYQSGNAAFDFAPYENPEQYYYVVTDGTNRSNKFYCFRDEFAGSSIDQFKTCWEWYNVGQACRDRGGTGNQVNGYNPSRVTESSGSAHINVVKNGSPVQYPNSCNGGDGTVPRDWESGVITTDYACGESSIPLFAFTYGQVEIEAKPPAGNGFWTSLYLLPVAATTYKPDEIDILEQLGKTPRSAQLSTHAQGGGSCNTSTDDSVSLAYAEHNTPPAPDTDWTAAYHTYKVIWDATGVYFYIDGTQRTSVLASNHCIPDHPMFLIIDTAVGASGSFAGPTDGSTPTSANLDIAAVRISTANPVTP